MGACAEGLPWPVLDRVRALGLPGRIDPASVVLETLSPGKIHPTSTEKLSPSQVGPSFTLTTKRDRLGSARLCCSLEAVLDSMHRQSATVVISCSSVGMIR